MPPSTRRTSKSRTVGGVTVTVAEIRTAIDILTSAAGIMVKQPLARAEHPLAATDYHGVAAEQRQIDEDPTEGTKTAFVRALERLAAEQ
jgi:hypothetical protein